MSQFPHAPAPGAYVPPNDGSQSTQGTGFNPQQTPYYGQQQASAGHQQSAPSYGSHQSHKTSSTAAFGKMFDQAVTTGKPMLNKFGKALSSKLGNKPSGPSTPQYLESYSSYQEHQQQQNQPPTQQAQGHSYSPQPQQQQWQQPQSQPQSQQQSAYPTPQQSPFPHSNPQSNYATPASNNSGQSNYFAQQNQQTPQSPIQQPAQQPGPGHDPNQFTQGQSSGVVQQQNPATQGQYQQGQFGQDSKPQTPQGQYGQAQFQPQAPQAQFGQNQPQGQYQGQTNQGQNFQGQYQQDPLQVQQTGVIGSSQTNLQGTMSPPPQPSTGATSFPPQPGQPGQQQGQQQQWAPPTPGPGNAQVTSQNVSPAPQQTHPFGPAPTGQQYNPAPTQTYDNRQVPSPPEQQQQQFQHPQQQQQQPSQQQWSPMSPVQNQGQFSQQNSQSVSPPPPQHTNSMHQVPQQPQHQHQESSTSQAAPTEFLAELPADLGNLSMNDNSKAQRPPSNPQSPYQAYQPAGAAQNQSPRMSIPRRAVSTSSLPVADPWRIADPNTELPTREFYILADLLFDALDRKFEPQCTGLLEASKILESWRVQGLEDGAAQILSYDSFRAFAKLWSLQGIPHLLVPSQPSLMPLWTFQPQTQSQELRVQAEGAVANATYPEYMPALNRAGWYKFFFVEVLGSPEGLEKVVSAFCAETYKPGVFNQPDLHKRDGNEVLVGGAGAGAGGEGGLVSRVKTVRQAFIRVFQETAAAQGGGGGAGGGGIPQAGAGLSEHEIAAKVQGLSLQQQMNSLVNQNMVGGAQGYSSTPAAPPPPPPPPPPAGGNSYVYRY